MSRTNLPPPFDQFRYQRSMNQYNTVVKHRGKEIEVSLSSENDFDLTDFEPALSALWKKRFKLFRVYREHVSTDQLFRINNFIDQTPGPLKELTKKQIEKILTAPTTIEIELETDSPLVRFTSLHNSFGDHAVQAHVSIEDCTIIDCETYCLY